MGERKYDPGKEIWPCFFTNLPLQNRMILKPILWPQIFQHDFFLSCCYQGFVVIEQKCWAPRKRTYKWRGQINKTRVESISFVIMDLKSLSLHRKDCMTLHLLHFMNVQKPLQWNQSNILTSFLRSMTTPFHWLPAAVRVACASHASVRARVLFTVYIPQMESLLSALLFGKKNPHSSIWKKLSR